ncbi:UNVERIFIED_CONTAM: hypothetical protein PYX00_007393 [Menopon gallinae]|uniref:RRP15-like protein n=1 Tax=Menopon gallinae TaxID=328185 RepID=A0AAW2HJ16_9NEOP
MEDSDGTCEDNSIEINSDDFDGDDTENVDGNPKLADALNKVLRMTRKKPKDKSLILSKAKLHNVNKQVKKETCGFEIEPNPNGDVPEIKEEEDIKPDIKQDKKTLKKIGLTKHEKLKRGRVIPSVLDREKERNLSKIATRGVVQLFNAVRQQQTSIEKQMKEKKLTESKREKILKSIDRKAFLDALSGTVNISLSKDAGDDVMKTEIKEEDTDNEENGEKPSWEVLRNDFMMGAKLKDWDKKGEEEMSE